MTTSEPILTLPGVSVDALEDAAVIAHSADWALAEGSFALSVVPQSAGGFQGLLSKDAKNFGTGGHIGLWIDDGAVYLRLQSEDASYEIRGGTVVPGQSLDIGVSFGSAGMVLYVDGAVVGTNGYTGGLDGNLEPVTLGASQWASGPESADRLTHLFRGEIGPVRLFGTESDGAGFDEVFGAVPGEAESGRAPVPGATVQRFEAEDFDATEGVGVFTQGGNRQIGATQDGEWVRYDGIDFGADPDAATTLTLVLSSGSGGGTVEVRTGTPEGPLLASYTTGNTGGWARYETVALDLGSVSGTQDLVFVFRGEAKSIMDIDRFEISGSAGSGAENRAPTVAPPFAALERDEESETGIDLSTVFADPDGDALSYNLAAGPGSVTIENGILRIAPQDGEDGVSTVSVTASDGALTSDPWSFELTVLDSVGPGPDPMATVQRFEAEDFDATEGVGVFTQGGNRQIGATQDGESVRYDAVDFGADPGATQTLELTLSSGSGGGTVEVRTGAPDGPLLAAYTTANTGGWANYDTVALDLGSVTGLQDLVFVFRGGARSIMDIDRFALTTTPSGAVPENRPPEPWRPFFDETSLDEGRVIAYSLPAVFRDPDGDPLTYAITEGPDFVRIENDPFPVLRFRPEDGDDGVYQVAVVASDGMATSAPWRFELTINDAIATDPDNAPPVVFIPLTGQEVPEGESRMIDVQHLFRDADGDALSYSLVGAPAFVSVDGSVVTASPGFDDAGIYEVGVVASDGQASSAPASITYEVLNAVPPAPAPSQSYSLVATADGLTADGAGGYLWDDAVAVSGTLRSGAPGDVVFSTQFNSFGYGVAGPGSRWDGQIDFYAENGPESERISFQFQQPATEAVLHVGMLGATEGPGRLPETGIWTTYDADGAVLASGLIGPEFSALGPGEKVADTYGSYPIEIASPAFLSLSVEATQFGHGAGASSTRSYGENSSDFNIQGLDFTLDDAYLL